MKNIYFFFLILFNFILAGSCKKEFNQKLEFESLKQGIKTSAAIGYCASIAVSAFEGKTLPSNVVYVKNTGLIYVKIDQQHPLPYNSAVGDIIIAGLWKDRGGIISILLSDIDLLQGSAKLYGVYTIPILQKAYNDTCIEAVFARQDIIMGYGSDTILNMGNITHMVFNTEMDRLNSRKPTDAFAAVKQNVWFVDINQANSSNNIYDDILTINGGGQIAEVKGTTGGVIYHALISAKLDNSRCLINPTDGFALIQNFKAGEELFVDLGNSFFSFHSKCDGKIHVEFSSGKYLNYLGRDVSLNIQ